MRKATEKEFPEGIPGYGADALRFTFAALASWAARVNFDSKRCEGYRNFCNKLWNATKFVLMNTEGQDCGLDSHVPGQCAPMATSTSAPLTAGSCRAAARGSRRGTRLCRIPPRQRGQQHLPVRVGRYCDWYIEIAKAQINAARDTRQRSGCPLPHPDPRAGNRAAPAAPHHALHHREELWHGRPGVAGRKAADSDDTIVVAPYPKAELGKVCAESDAWMAKLKAMVGTARNLVCRDELVTRGTCAPVDHRRRCLHHQGGPIVKALGKSQ